MKSERDGLAQSCRILAYYLEINFYAGWLRKPFEANEQRGGTTWLVFRFFLLTRIRSCRLQQSVHCFLVNIRASFFRRNPECASGHSGEYHLKSMVRSELSKFFFFSQSLKFSNWREESEKMFLTQAFICLCVSSVVSNSMQPRGL